MEMMDTGKEGGKQKKMTVRVDFTPMVDMLMLLITFFMLCTSLSKPSTMELTMPSNDKTQRTLRRMRLRSHTLLRFTLLTEIKSSTVMVNQSMITLIGYMLLIGAILLKASGMFFSISKLVILQQVKLLHCHTKI